MTDESQGQVNERLGEDVAEAEFKRFAAALRAKVNVSRMNDAQRDDFETNKRIIIDALRDGALVINEKGQPVYKPQCDFPTGPIVFRKPSGKTLMAANGLSENDGVRKTFKMLAELTHQNEPDLVALDMADLAIPMALVAVLFG